MKKAFISTIVAILLCSGCTKPEPQVSTIEFKYGQRVKITEGFYSGLKGTVAEEGQWYGDCHRTYRIRFDDMMVDDSFVCNSILVRI